MKVLMINGSPRDDSNTSLAFKAMTDVFEAEGVDYEIVEIGTRDIRGCIACRKCHETGRCVFDDIVNETALKLKEADGLVIGSPVYYGSANGSLISLLDRLFYSITFDLSMKVGASVVVARRGGLTATFDELNKYFTISEMPVATSCYWNQVHGHQKGEAGQDEEGLVVMKRLAMNMVFLMRSIALGKEKYGLPPKEEKRVMTNFIR
ncbi:MAG: flavodoxin family protein [Erysipelotrichaceae bacterium]|nr:flavodoxin family protein [Erysipelotrichaceae bacterium]